MPASVAAKKEGLGHERIQRDAPAAGNRSKEEWEQFNACRARQRRREEWEIVQQTLQREDEQKWEWVIAKEEAAQSAGSGDARPTQDAASSTAAKSAGSGSVRPDKVECERVSPKNEMPNNIFADDSRLVLPKGSVLLHRCDTKRSVAVQTVDPVEQEDSLWDWLTISTTVTEIHIQVKSEYVRTLMTTEMMTRMHRATSTTTCLTWMQT